MISKYLRTSCSNSELSRNMQRIIVIGDIHGQLKKLEGLLKRITPSNEDRLVFLGDYIDRGAESFGVVDLIARLKKTFPKTITLWGNHEGFVISLFNGNQSQYQRNIWLKMNGGDLTIASYRIKGFYLNVHQDFYMNLPLYWETSEYFFCHAGVRPGISLKQQKGSDLTEIREPFLSSHENFGKIIVHGHEPVDKPTIRFNRINIDTGAGIYGPLTAIELPSNKIYQQG
jgi:serine/threonine protein phosphatase 1